MIFRKTGLWVIGLLIILFPVAAAADEGSTHGRWWQSPAMEDRINLSPQERQTLDDLYTQKRKDLFDMRAEVERQRLEMDSVLEAPSLDQRAAFKRFIARIKECHECRTWFPSVPIEDAQRTLCI